MRRKKKEKADGKSKPKKKPKYNENSAIRSALRRAFSRSPIVREVLLEHRREVPKFKKDGSRCAKDAVQYQCQSCGAWVSSTNAQVDHFIPVIEEDGTFVDWNTYIKRLWCDKSNLKVICKDKCHAQKTQEERKKRSLAKKNKGK